jgi:hypothetical protein
MAKRKRSHFKNSRANAGPAYARFPGALSTALSSLLNMTAVASTLGIVVLGLLAAKQFL